MELDQQLFPLNKKSTQKEPQTWGYELRRQGVAPSVLSTMQHAVDALHQATLRAKKSVACLMWITDRPIVEIEKVLTQFGGSFDGAAGPVRSVATRSCDLLPTVARVAELLHPGLDLAERQARLLTRLELGVPGSLVDLARLTGSRLTRGDYLRLYRAGLTSMEAIEDSSDEQLLQLLGANEEKLGQVRQATERHRREASEITSSFPILPPYEP
ncbi:MAG: hypothetical protein M3Q71_22100 [Chloroflexota bacterium]|nr:hypothetical protein [Chloroflexota bacterium]